MNDQTYTQERITETLARRQAKLEHLLALQASMERILACVPPDSGITAITAGEADDVIQFSSLSREEVTILLASLHAGKWEKKVCHADGSKVDYETTIEGVKVLMFCSEAPASCRIEVEEIEIPASKKVVRKLICA